MSNSPAMPGQDEPIPQSQPELTKRLQEAVSEIHVLREIFNVPSISFGVVHEGKVLLSKSIGYRDVENGLAADPDTIYHISSCTKMFTSAGIGLLVDEGKLQWRDLISKYIPEFNPKGNPRIATEADVIDLLRHSLGISEPFNLYIGPRGCHLQHSGPAGLIPILNTMRTADSDGQWFNRHWMYSNSSFILAGELISRLSGLSYTEFIRSRILRPLGMYRSVLSKDDVSGDTNVACQYTVLGDGTFKKLRTEHWPFGKRASDLPGSAMGSSLNDLLTWCIAVLSAQQTEKKTNPVHLGNPLRGMNRLRRPYWTRPPQDPETSNEAAFGRGWMRMTLPTSMVGTYSGNVQTRKAPRKQHLRRSNILGMNSAPRVMIGHSGGAIGGIATVWTFPETQSAVVTLTNGRAWGDASDFAAQVLIQALFGLDPKVDLIPWARDEAELGKKSLVYEFLEPWKTNRRLDDIKLERNRECYVGLYPGFDGLFALEISLSDGLAVMFNHVELTKSDMVLFKKDTYSFFTGDLDYWAAEWFPYRDYRQTLLEFDVDETGNVLGLWWMWDTDEERAWFVKENNGAVQ